MRVRRILLDISANIKILIEMVEQEQPCPQILCHITAIKKQLQKLKIDLFICQINQSTLIIQNNSDVFVQLRELDKLRELLI